MNSFLSVKQEAHQLSQRKGIICDALLCQFKSCQPLHSYTNKSSVVAEMGNRLATIDIGRKVGAVVSLSRGKLGSNLTQFSGVIDHATINLCPHQIRSATLHRLL